LKIFRPILLIRTKLESAFVVTWSAAEQAIKPHMELSFWRGYSLIHTDYFLLQRNMQSLKKLY